MQLYVEAQLKIHHQVVGRYELSDSVIYLRYFLYYIIIDFIIINYYHFASQNESAVVVLSPSQNAILQIMPGDSSFDTKFVRTALYLLYDGEMDKLSHRSVHGTKERVVRSRNGVTKLYPAKPPITPQKLNAIRSLYNQRIEKKCPDALDFSKRLAGAYFNKIVHAVLSNCARQSTKKVGHENFDDFPFEIDEVKEVNHMECEQ